MGLRVTDLGLSSSRTAWIMQGRSKVAESQHEIGTGRKISQPSDQPNDSARLMGHELRLSRIGQFERNTTNARLWVGAADQALQSASNNMARARTLAIQGANGTLGAVELKALADDIRSIAEGMVAIANTKVSGRAIFAGTANATAAYDVAGTYLGDDGEVTRTIDTDETVVVASNGPDVFGTSDVGNPLNGSVFEVLNTLADSVEAGDNPGIRDGLEAIDVSTARMSGIQGNIGAISQQLDAAEFRHGGERINAEADVTALRDVDLAEAIIRLRSAEASYEATLSATSRALNRSLLDFLR